MDILLLFIPIISIQIQWCLLMNTHSEYNRNRLPGMNCALYRDGNGSRVSASGTSTERRQEANIDRPIDLPRQADVEDLLKESIHVSLSRS